MEYRAETEIQSSTGQIWSILTQAEEYPNWEPNVVKIEGSIEADRRITVHTRYSNRAIPLKVTSFEPGRQMEWSWSLPLGLFRRTRKITLEPTDRRTVRFETSERTSGLLAPLLKKLLPDLSRPFVQFVEGLRNEAERTSGPSPWYSSRSMIPA